MPIGPIGNRAIQGNVATQVTQPGGQLCKQCKWRHLMKATRLLESSRSRLDLLLTFLLHFQNKTKQNTKRQIQNTNTNTKYRLPKKMSKIYRLKKNWFLDFSGFSRKKWCLAYSQTGPVVNLKQSSLRFQMNGSDAALVEIQTLSGY